MISIIGCKSINGMIGKNNELVFKNLKTDMDWFIKYTKNKYVIMGRKTWESLPKKPLKNRVNIVVTSNKESLPDDCMAMTIDELMDFIKENSKGYLYAVNEFVVIGGAKLYKTMIPFADKIFLTTVQAYADGDTIFPYFDQIKYKPTLLYKFNEIIDGVSTPATITMYEKYKGA